MIGRFWVYGALALMVTAVGGLGLGYHRGVAAERTRAEARQAQELRAALTRVQQRQAQVERLQAQQAKLRDQAEADYAQMQGEIDRVRDAADRARRMRDPGARAAGGGAVPAAAGCAGVSVDNPAGSELSAAADGFLRQFAERCDRAAAYATAAHRWAVKLPKPGRPDDRED